MNIKNMYKKSLKATALIAVVAILAVFALLGAACNNSEDIPEETLTDPHSAAVYAENVANAMIKIFDKDDADMPS